MKEYPVRTPRRVPGAAIPVGWKIVEDEKGNLVYVRDKAETHT